MRWRCVNFEINDRKNEEIIQFVPLFLLDYQRTFET